MTSPAGRRWEIPVLCAILALHAWTLSAYFVPVLGGTDQHSYHLASRMLERHGRFHAEVEDELVFLGGMAVENERGEVYPKYPPVYPALAGLALALCGDPAGLLVNPICALLAVLGAYAACRAILPGWAALLAAWFAATTPALNLLAVDQVSHPSSTATLTWGFALFLWAEWRPERGRSLLLLGAGLLVGLAGGIRFPNVLLALAPTLWLVRQRQPRRLALWLLGLALPYAGVLLYNQLAFGHPLRTAYSLTHEDAAFSLANIPRSARVYLPALATEIVGPLVFLSCAGLLLKWMRDPARGAFYTLWIGPLALLYFAYYFLPAHHPPSYIRFLLPLVLPCILLALGFVRDRLRGLDARLAGAILAALVLGQSAWALPRSLRHLEMRYGFNELQQRKLELIREHVPAGSVVFAARLLLDDLDYGQSHVLYVNELLSQPDLRRVRARFFARDYDQRGRQHELDELAALDPEDYHRRVRGLIDARMEEGREVFLVGGARVERLFSEAFSGDYDTEVLAELRDVEPRHVLFRARPRVLDNPVWQDTRVLRVRRRGE